MARGFYRTRGAQRAAVSDAIEKRELERRARLKANPQRIVENILSRKLVCEEVARRMIARPDDGQDAAVQFVAERWGVPAETVRDCISVEALETGQ